MIELFQPNQRAVDSFQAICKRRGPFHVADILTGYIGLGARDRLKKLGVRKARIVFGLQKHDAPVAPSLVGEIERLQRNGFAAVRISMGLHANLFIFDKRVVCLGSANPSRSGFETLLLC